MFWWRASLEKRGCFSTNLAPSTNKACKTLRCWETPTLTFLRKVSYLHCSCPYTLIFFIRMSKGKAIYGVCKTRKRQEKDQRQMLEQWSLDIRRTLRTRSSFKREKEEIEEVISRKWLQHLLIEKEEKKSKCLVRCVFFTCMAIIPSMFVSLFLVEEKTIAKYMYCLKESKCRKHLKISQDPLFFENASLVWKREQDFFSSKLQLVFRSIFQWMEYVVRNWSWAFNFE